MSFGNQPEPFFDDDGDDIRDLLAVYALGGLTDEESRQFEVALDNDNTLEDELYELTEIVGQLGLLAHAEPLPSAMEAQLMARVEANSAARFGRAEAAPALKIDRSSESAIDLFGWVRNLFTPQLATGFALAGFLVMVGLSVLMNRQVNTLNGQIASLTGEVTGLEISLETANSDRNELVDRNADIQAKYEGLLEERSEYEGVIAQLTGDNVLLSQEVNGLTAERDTLMQEVATLTEANLAIESNNIDLNLQVSDLEKVVGLFDSPTAELFSVAGTEAQPSASGQIVFDRESDVAILSVANLPELEEDQVYQVLLIRGEAHDTADTFVVDASGEGFLIIQAPSDFATFDTLGVSIEPEGGSVQRTGEIVMVGSLIN